MPNERYVKISLKGKWNEIPYDANGDPAFERIEEREDYIARNEPDETALLNVFYEHEIVALVNFALYVKKYNRETHAKRQARKSETKETK